MCPKSLSLHNMPLSYKVMNHKTIRNTSEIISDDCQLFCFNEISLSKRPLHCALYNLGSCDLPILTLAVFYCACYTDIPVSLVLS